MINAIRIDRSNGAILVLQSQLMNPVRADVSNGYNGAFRDLALRRQVVLQQVGSNIILPGKTGGNGNGTA